MVSSILALHVMVTSIGENNKLEQVKVRIMTDNVVMPFTRWDYGSKCVVHSPNPRHGKCQFLMCTNLGIIVDETDSLAYAMLWLIKDE